MKSFLKLSAWLFYILGTVLFFVYLLFPADALRIFAEKELHKRTGVVFQVSSLSLVFPLKISMGNSTIEGRKGFSLKAEKADLSPSFTAFFRGQAGGKLSLRTLGGDISAVMRMPMSSPLEARGQMQLSNLDMDALLALSPQPLPFGVQGRVSGRFIWEPVEEKLGVRGNLDISGGDLLVDFPMGEFPAIRLNSVQLESQLEKGRLEIENILVSGSFGTLHLAGSITGVLGPSGRLNLSGGIRPDSVFLQQLTRMGGIGPMVSRFAGQREIPVRIAGTLESPQLTLAGIRL
ncbi:type II secretion system protein GspN [Desulfobotulus mexicanus]|uniref:Type II secretion system protein GspN n=1 Tax=Desulfobotulus mexicanus TaxID=2586642 RepID=A0A5Q4VHV8_9BACT|nr:type II secretion system protein GspN [Desulfobotulus mexicanus]TYT75760.1 type II secretion system protein GspN [Desulfobotulus mexicanus]